MEFQRKENVFKKENKIIIKYNYKEPSAQNTRKIQDIYKHMIYNIFKNIIILLTFNYSINKISSNTRIMNLKFSYIILSIKQGNNSIYNEGKHDCSKYIPHPDEIFINGKNQSIIKSYYIFNETNNNVILKWENEFNDTTCMFYQCRQISSIDLSNFNSSLIKKTRAMFCGCSSLVSINLSNFDTSKVKDMAYMFSGCQISSLDLSEFYTTEAINFFKMFNGCSSLKSLNLSTFDTSNVKEMSYMFNGCKKLYSLNLSNFNTSKVINMSYIFTGCESLNFLDLSFFDTSKVKNISYMFSGCKNLTFLYISNFDTSEIQDMNEIFKDCSKLENLGLFSNSKAFKNIQENKLICSINDIKIPSWNYYALINCDSNFKLICYQHFSDNFSYYNICEICGPNYYLTQNHTYTTYNFYINCSIFIPETTISTTAYYTSYIQESTTLIKTSQIINNVNNLEDYTDYQKIMIENNSKNSLYFSYINDFPSVSNKIDNLINTCDFNNKNNTCEISIKNEANNQDVTELLINKITDGSMKQIFEQMKKNDSDNALITIKEEKASHSIASMSYMMKKMDISSVNFGDCEQLLKLNYSFNNIEDLIMYKIEHYVDGIKIPILEYSLFLYDNNNITQINLDICNDMSIIYYIPIQIDGDDINRYNPNSELYNDECITYKSESGTDMSLYDRQNTFNLNHMSLCEKGCTYLRYDFNKSRVECLCKLKNDLTFGEDDINIDDLLAQIETKKKSTNIIVTSCNLSACTDNIVSNFASYILLFFIAIFIIIFIIFCKKGYRSLENKIDDIIYKKFKHKKKTKSIILTNNENIKKKKKVKKIKKLKRKKDISISISSKKELKKPNIQIKNKLFVNANNIAENKQKNSTNFNPETDYEFNWLSYEEAVGYDKRTKCDYYSSLIKSKQLFFFTFCTFNDYNSGIIKKFIFFLSFALHYTVNALFFDDNNMHQIIEDKGKYNFIYQLPKIIYSTIISNFILRLILHLLVLTDKDILMVKLQPTKGMANDMKKKRLKCMIIKFTIFFVLNFILLGLFWYYLTCLNAIYSNTQVYFIENTFISFGFSLIYPFIINIFPTMIRMCSIHSSNNKKFFYKVSQVLQLI